MGHSNNPSYVVDDRVAALFLDVAVQHGPCNDVNSVAVPGVERGVPDPPPVSDSGYKIIKAIGGGGMGIVWLARQLGTGQLVALKSLKLDQLQKSGTIARFHTEVRLAAKLKHPNIARVFDSGLDQLDYFYVMELVDGLPIDEYVSSNDLSTNAIIALVLDICDAVAYAHTQEVIHLDLKPSNILVTESGHPYILDFGLARILGQPDHIISYRAGTHGYVAPEQRMFNQSLDQRADIYAIGRVLERVFTGVSTSYADLVTNDISAVILRATNSDRDLRYQQMGELSRDLKNIIESRPVAAQDMTIRYTCRLWAKRNKRYLVRSIFLAIVVLLIGAGITVPLAQREQALQQRNHSGKEALYTSAIRSARESLNQDDVLAAQRYLQQADQDLRNWEWRHLALLADQSTHTISIDDTIILDFSLLESGLLACLTSNGNISRLNLSDEEWIASTSGEPTTAPLAISPNAEFTVGLDRKGHGVIQPNGKSKNTAVTPLADSAVICQKISPSSQYVLIGTIAGELHIYDMKLGDIIHSVPMSSKVSVACFSNDEHNLLWYDRGYHVLDLKTLTARTISVQEQGGYGPIAMAALGNTLVAGLADGTIMEYSISGDGEGSPITRLPAEISAISISPDGNTISCGTSNGTLYRIEDGAEPVVLNGHTSAITKIDYSSDGRLVLTLASDGIIKIWDSGWEPYTVQAWPSKNALFYSSDADGRYLSYTSPEPVTKITDTLSSETQDRKTEWWGLPTSMALSSDATRVAIASSDRVVLVHNTNTRVKPKAMAMETGPANWLCFDNEGMRIAASNSQELAVWDYEAIEQPFTLSSSGPVAWIPSNQGELAYIIQNSLGYDLEVRNVDTHEHVYRQSLGSTPIIDLSAATDIGRMATLDDAGKVQILDIHAQRVVTSIQAGGLVSTLAVALAPDGKRVVTAGERVEIWSVDTGELLDVIEERIPGLITKIHFAADGRELIGLSLTGYHKWRTR